MKFWVKAVAGENMFKGLFTVQSISEDAAKTYVENIMKRSGAPEPFIINVYDKPTDFEKESEQR